MRVLLVSDYATPTGGAELALLALGEGLERRGHEVRFFSSTAAPAGSPNLADDRCLGTLGRMRTLLQCANVSAFFRLRRVVRDFRPDVAHVALFLTQLSPLILPVLRSVPAVYHVHWCRPICPIGTKFRPDCTECFSPMGVVCYSSGCLPLYDWIPLMGQMKLWRRWSSSFQRIIANSESMRQRLLAEGLPVSGVIWNGVPLRPPRPPLTDPPTVVFAGRLVREKGADVLVRAFARVSAVLPHAQLLIAGTGPEQIRLTGLVAELDLSSHVTFLGFLPHPLLEQSLARAWVQAVPSLCAESFGMVAAEALMRGTAVVASASGGLPEIVDHETTGYLVPPNDEMALAEALLRLLSDRNLAETMGAAGGAIARARFGMDAHVEKFIDCYQGLSRGTR